MAQFMVINLDEFNQISPQVLFLFIMLINAALNFFLKGDKAK